jgi:insulysin
VLPEQPVLILDEPSIKLYYLQDTEFRRPKASLIYRLRLETSSANLTRSVALDLAVACINEQLNEMAYPALLAGARFQLSRDDRGFVMRLSGYDRSLEKLLLKSLDGMTKLSLNQERFDAIVDRMVRSWNNFSKESAHKQARLIARSIRREIAFSPQNKAKIAETLSRSDVEATIANMWSRLNIEALAHGNLTAAEATSITQRLRRELMVTGLKKEDVFVHKTLTWPEPEQLVVRDELDTNNACYRLDLWLGLDNPFLRIASRVMDNFVSQPFYVEMRTRQQLGYIVGSATYRDEDQHYLVFIIQSGTHNAQQLAERCRTYIPNLTQALQELSAEEFSALKEAVKKELQEKPKSISAKASILFNLAFNENGNFDLNEELLTQLELLTQEKLITLLTKALSPKFERSFALELFAKGAEPALLGGGLENIQTFKSKRVYKAAP